VDVDRELTWRTANSCGNGACVEIARDGQDWLVRDTKDGGAGANLRFTAEEWRAFVEGVRAGEFDLPD